ncbi:hypothetical protein WJX82_010184 [Trebouxia sp. C0006]
MAQLPKMCPWESSPLQSGQRVSLAIGCPGMNAAALQIAGCHHTRQPMSLISDLAMQRLALLPRGRAQLHSRSARPCSRDWFMPSMQSIATHYLGPGRHCPSMVCINVCSQVHGQ